MQKTILITGSTDGIGLETAKILVSKGHHVLLHGRNADKLGQVENRLAALSDDGIIESFVADLSRLNEVETLAKTVTARHSSLDVLINNAGVLRSSESVNPDGLDVRFVVNAIAPYLLTQRLLSLMDENGRVINLSSAAQSPVNLDALAGNVQISDDMTAYAQSKLAITMWSRAMALSLKDKGPVIVAVNPGSLLATKMVKEGFGMEGNDIRIGADILTRASLSDEFSSASGLYFDNDTGQFTLPHRDALDSQKSTEVIRIIDLIISRLIHQE